MVETIRVGACVGVFVGHCVTVFEVNPDIAKHCAQKCPPVQYHGMVVAQLSRGDGECEMLNVQSEAAVFSCERDECSCDHTRSRHVLVVDTRWPLVGKFGLVQVVPREDGRVWARDRWEFM
jgi:hypothetical protein